MHFFRFLPSKNTRFRIQAAAFLAVALSVATMAQTFRGAISGTVTDQTGAALSGAKIKVENDATGLTRELTAGSNGDYAFQDLPLGKYTVTVSQTGFQTLRVANLNVAVGSVTALPVKLEVARQAMSVEVVSAPVALETESTALNSVVNNTAVQNAPLNGRDFRQLINLAPGVNGAGSLNGGRSDQTNWQIDGADNNDLWHNSVAVNQGGVGGIPGPYCRSTPSTNSRCKAAATRNPDATAPGQSTSSSSRARTRFTVRLYYFNRNDALAEPNPFTPVGKAKGKLKNNQFGGSLGGPIVKNKLFYFLTYERQKLIIGNNSGALEPSPAWVSLAQGVLSRFNVPVNPVSLNLLSFWPAQGRTGPATNPNAFANDNSDNYSDNVIGKIDYNINDKNTLAFRYFVGTGKQTAPVGSPYSPFANYFQIAPSRMHNFSLVHNAVITPRIVNQLVAGVNYFKQVFIDADTSFNPIAAGLNTGVTNPTLIGSPDITVGGFDELGPTPPLGRIDTTGHLTDTVTYTAGAHQLRFGGEYRRSRGDVFYQRNGRGTFAFDGSQGPWSTDRTLDGNTKALADFLAGYVQSFFDHQR